MTWEIAGQKQLGYGHWGKDDDNRARLGVIEYLNVKFSSRFPVRNTPEVSIMN